MLFRAVVMAVGVALIAGAGSASGAPLNPKLEWAAYGAGMWWPAPACGVESARAKSLGPVPRRIQMLDPDVGAKMTNIYGVELGTVTAVSVTRSGRRSGQIRITAVGSGAMCRADPPSRDEREAGVIWSLQGWIPTPPGERRFHAWTPVTSRPTLRIAARQRGTCSQSWVNPRPDAYRCITGRYVIDSCIEAPDIRRLLCAPTPWTPWAILVKMTHYDDVQLTGRRGPWAIRTANGKRCTFLSGAGAPLRAGRRMNYRCGPPQRPEGASAYLWGRPSKHGGRGRILYSSTPESDLRWMRIQEIWN